jgi:hypothetical protein
MLDAYTELLVLEDEHAVCMAVGRPEWAAEARAEQLAVVDRMSGSRAEGG